MSISKAVRAAGSGERKVKLALEAKSVTIPGQQRSQHQEVVDKPVTVSHGSEENARGEDLVLRSESNDLAEDRTDDLSIDTKPQNRDISKKSESDSRPKQEEQDMTEIFHENPPTLVPIDMEENTPEEDLEYPTGMRLVFIIIALASAIILVGLDFGILATAVPAITTHFQTVTDIGWYYSAYRLSMCAFQFMFGKMYSVFSVKVVFLTSLCIFEAGSLVSGSATTSAAVVVGRAISGFGSAGLVSGFFTIATQIVPLRQRPILGGFGSGVEGVASTLAPLLGGILTDNISWRWCFYINIPLGAITFLIISFYFQNPRVSEHASLPLRDKIRKLDLLGTAIFVPSIVCLLLALQWGGSKYGWADARIISLLIFSPVLIGVFAWMQWRRQDEATLPPRIMSKRSLLAGMWFSLCNNTSISVIDYYLPTYFQVVKGVSATKSGVLCLPIVIGLFAGTVAAGPLVTLSGYYTPFMILTGILTPVATGLMTTIQVDASLSSLICYQALLGFGTGIGFQGPQVAMQAILSQQDVSIGLGAIVFAQNFGPAIFVPVAQTIFTGPLTACLEKFVPDVDSNALENLGLLNLKDHVPSADLAGALLGYDEAITTTFILPIALAVCSLVGALAMEWRSIKQKKA